MGEVAQPSFTRVRVADRRPRILIVEDDPELAGALSAALESANDVSTASDVPSALSLLAAERFDLVLLDLILPKGTGLDILAALAARHGEAPPVLVMSGLGREVDLAPFQMILAGVLTKPFGLDALIRQVKEALEGARQAAPAANRSAGSVLLVDDDVELLEGMADYLRGAGYGVRAAGSAQEALDALTHERFDATVTDWIMPGMTGMELLGKVKALAPHMPVLLLTGYGTPDLTRRAISAGAADVLVKPFPPRALPVALEKCLHQAVATAVTVKPPAAAATAAEAKGARSGSMRYTAEDIIGNSAAIVRTRHELARAAAVNSCVLIHGETGTGKELFAQALHGLSPRAKGPFVALNAAAIPESLLESELFGYAAGAFTGAKKDGQKGKFLQADGGTLFLDEIGDLPLTLQVKLLRVLQEGEVDLVGGGSKRVDVRVVVATHRNLEEMVAQGSFRSDLYFRLNVVTLTLPPLRERAGDVPLLATRFLDELCVRYGRPGVQFSAEVLETLAAHRWPGNVRELRNVVERAFALSSGNLILPVDLPPGLRQAPPPAVVEVRGTAMRQAPRVEPLLAPAGAPSRDLASQEREAIVRALEETGGNKVQAAKLLGISRAGLYVKIKVYGIA